MFWSGPARCWRVKFIAAWRFDRAGASIRPGIRIDQDAVIGVGAAVVRNIEGGAIMGGVPAKPIRIADPN